MRGSGHTVGLLFDTRPMNTIHTSAEDMLEAMNALDLRVAWLRFNGLVLRVERETDSVETVVDRYEAARAESRGSP